MKNHLLLISIIFSSFFVNAQNPDWLWGNVAGGNYYDLAQGMCQDFYGNIYITGHFESDSLLFGNEYFINLGHSDVFVAKYDSAGDFQWAITGGGSQYDFANDIYADQQGFIYIIGTSYSSNFQIGSTGFSTMGFGGYFVSKISINGFPQWAVDGGTEFVDIGNGICGDQQGNIYATGEYRGNTMFLTKFSSAGAEIWTKMADSSGNCFGESVNILSTGEIVVAGMFEDSSITFENITLQNNGEYDIYVAKYLANGDFVSAFSIGNDDYDYVNDISTDNFGNFYLTGSFYSLNLFFGDSVIINNNHTAELDALYIAKYGNSNAVEWIKTGSSDFDTWAICSEADQFGNLYVVGDFWEEISFDGNPISAVGQYECFIARFNPAGEIVWAESIGSERNDFAKSICIEDTNRIYILGGYEYENISIADYTYSNLGEEDIFLAKRKAKSSVFVPYEPPPPGYVSFLETKFELYQNSPNPFVDVTKISFYLPKNSYVNISTYSIHGEMIECVLSKKLHSGEHSVIVTAENYSHGTYLYKISSQEFSKTKRMMIQ
ncbi:MAG: T9SS type A sorting domain-containing protein [Bacteroidetes bacterium]|jgi:hypothetical protein|nr:T9SS type A sorting domain-containing protein [Bacteroidota bacterium]MBT6686412.1 T9SS type A sorting domain-containing protein [Bacteroidota bacterium]MBT7142245.1 T9SS type A sorting domain-containing protein [Bacteroidota bacterium]MBT7491611.1 T9SS type A sorting domain-containing protein [Bacteroidota bacterium]